MGFILVVEIIMGSTEKMVCRDSFASFARECEEKHSSVVVIVVAPKERVQRPILPLIPSIHSYFLLFWVVCLFLCLLLIPMVDP
jgi:hypothetical protein